MKKEKNQCCQIWAIETPWRLAVADSFTSVILPICEWWWRQSVLWWIWRLKML